MNAAFLWASWVLVQHAKCKFQQRKRNNRGLRGLVCFVFGTTFVDEEGPGSPSGLKEPSNNPTRLKNQLNPPSEPVHCLQQSSVPTLTNKLKET
ncbi:hypothetical protein BCR33DRAFT_290020 [Rhizoclosmatium globosum]|nr:hypothetical protein BCR33DRAFT_290020 [Rhizoclosmatium globosum]|eukprot:ORY42932.1 hypothetical protein BCR33DRAFT_290020 [Rhizoclosmatium globosum]